MQSKIIFLVLFMLSFTVMHDTVINCLNDDKNVLVSHYVSVDEQASDIVDVHDLHEMFHFMALLLPSISTFENLKNEQTLFAYLSPYASPHLENSTRPPIV